ncbi:MAG TPA: ABC transporter substrate-binding protein [Deltaproteobacteria bacterium]|nr:ABC transporter substrate-binding protein [Deltaproteobacteria bacterium]
MKRMFFVMFMVSAVFLMAGPADAARPGFDAKEIRIAQWGPQTGPAAPWGSVARGSDLIFKMVNDEGGIHGRKIKYYIRDDQYNPAQTKGVVKELVEREGIFAFVGGVGAACGMAVKDYLAANKVIWVGPSTAISEYVFPVNPYLFAVYPLYEDEGSILTKYVVEKLKANERLKALPVIIVSYKDRDEDRIRGLDAGADYYLTKGSFHDNSFIQAVTDLAGGSLR